MNFFVVVKHPASSQFQNAIELAERSFSSRVQQQKKRFSSIESRVDELNLRYKKGDQSEDNSFLFCVWPKKSLYNGAWHTVNMTTDTTNFAVTVDAVSHRTTFEIDVLAYLSNILENFYLGGMEHEGASPTMDKEVLRYGVNVTSYGGCLANLEINEQLVDVEESQLERQFCRMSIFYLERSNVSRPNCLS